MSPTTLPGAPREKGLTGRHVLIAFLSFFGVIFAVNGVLLHRALSTHGGVVANEPYMKGLEYNRRIEADERQAQLGWNANTALTRAGQVTVAFADTEGRPVRGLAVTGVLGRPAANAEDVSMRFSETAPGLYVASAGGIDPGTWLLSVEADRNAPGATGDTPEYRLKRRLWLAP